MITATTLRALLGMDHLPVVVDVGASAFEGAPPYRTVLEEQCCRLIGFEPNLEEWERLHSTDYATYLPYALGDGETHTFYRCAFAGMNSFLKPDASRLALYPLLEGCGEVLGEEAIPTRRMDDLPELRDMTFLKMDVQGSELAILQHGKSTWTNATLLHIEVAFSPLYVGQPLFADVDAMLRSEGYVFHTFAELHPCLVAPITKNGGSAAQGIRHTVDADAVYLKDFATWDDWTDRELQATAFFLHTCYHSFDVAARCVQELAKRGVVESDALQRYLYLLTN